MNSSIKFLLEFLPLIVFFIVFKFYGIMNATISIMVAITLCSIIYFIIEKKVSIMNLITLTLILVLGSITILSGESKFIKMKPTFVNLTFSVILFLGTIFNKGFLKYIFGNSFEMSDNNWIIFSRRWSIFFFCSAILNEIIWRNFSDNFWVNFKVFGSMTLTILFLLTQIKFITTNSTFNK